MAGHDYVRLLCESFAAAKREGAVSVWKAAAKDFIDDKPLWLPKEGQQRPPRVRCGTCEASLSCFSIHEHVKAKHGRGLTPDERHAATEGRRADRKTKAGAGAAAFAEANPEEAEAMSLVRESTAAAQEQTEGMLDWLTAMTGRSMDPANAKQYLSRARAFVAFVFRSPGPSAPLDVSSPATLIDAARLLQFVRHLEIGEKTAAPTLTSYRLAVHALWQWLHYKHAISPHPTVNVAALYREQLDTSGTLMKASLNRAVQRHKVKKRRTATYDQLEERQEIVRPEEMLPIFERGEQRLEAQFEAVADPSSRPDAVDPLFLLGALVWHFMSFLPTRIGDLDMCIGDFQRAATSDTLTLPLTEHKTRRDPNRVVHVLKFDSSTVALWKRYLTEVRPVWTGVPHANVDPTAPFFRGPRNGKPKLSVAFQHFGSVIAKVNLTVTRVRASLHTTVADRLGREAAAVTANGDGHSMRTAEVEYHISTGVQRAVDAFEMAQRGREAAPTP